MTDFVSYPSITAEGFYEKTFTKKEFLKTYTGPEFHTRDPEEACKPGEFRLQNHQEFVRNFISPDTPYNGLLLFHGTGVGKCVHPKTMISVNNKTVQIDSLWEQYKNLPIINDGLGEWIELPADIKLSVNSLENGKIVTKSIKRLYRQLVNEPLRTVTTEMGDKITITKAHKLLTEQNWTTAYDNLRIAQPIRMVEGTNSDISESLIYLLAWQIAEGHERSNNDLYITNNDQNVLHKLHECLLEIAATENFVANVPNIHKNAGRSPYLRISSMGYRKFIESKGYTWGKLSAAKTIPSFIEQLNNKLLSIFLRVFFDAEAHVNKSLKRIEISSASRQIIMQLRSLLLRFGIEMQSNIKIKSATNGKNIKREYYEGIISSISLDLFKEYIGFETDYKEDNLTTICNITRNPNLQLCNVNDILREIKSYTKLPNTVFLDKMYLLSDKRPSKKSLKSIISNLEAVHAGTMDLPKRGSKDRVIDAKLLTFIEQLNIHVTREYNCYSNFIVEQDYSGYVYDLEIPDVHNYVANGIICHNTCAAISITEGLRDYVHKLGKKIYIVSKEAIADNFIRELYSEQRAQREKEMHSPPGSYQCAGDRYHISELEEPNPVKRLIKIKEKIKKYYTFITPDSFPGHVLKLRGRTWVRGKEGKEWEDLGMNDEQIAEHFMNSVFVIDEAHGIAGQGKIEGSKKRREKKAKQEEKKEAEQLQEDQSDSDGSVIDIDQDVELETKRKIGMRAEKTFLEEMHSIIKDCRKLGGNIKLLLLTATPMKDNTKELADLLEILNMNDGSDFDRNQLFPDDSESNFDRDYLVAKAKGYISYVRGNNPITFPTALLPPVEQLYEPTPLLDMKNREEMAEDQYQIRLAEDIYYKYDLVKCPMSLYQFKAFLRVRDEIKEFAEGSTRQISIFALPTPNIEDCLLGPEKPDVKSAKKLFGASGVRTVFDKVDTVLQETGTRTKKYQSYQYNLSTLKNYGLFLMQNNPVKPEISLSTCSQKFSQIINNINSINGICYAYSSFKSSSVNILAMALEANGFLAYTPLTKYSTETGLPTNADPTASNFVPQSRYLTYNSSEAKEQFTKHLKRNYRCAVCGKLFKDDGINHEGDDKLHRFVQATYLLITGDTSGIKKHIDIMRTQDNIRGHRVKVILGTKVTSEGIDFRFVRQVHVIEPWHNNTTIYQAIGRGIRNCSHIELPPDERNVTIFKYSSTVPELNVVTEDDGIISLTKPSSQLDNVKELFDEEISAVYKGADQFETGITYKDIVTETADERVYNRVVVKDVNVKKIERILKQVAVDCRLNKHINYYGNSDLDYSRECDYQLCNYDCIGQADSEVKFTDLVMTKMGPSEFSLFSKFYGLDRDTQLNVVIIKRIFRDLNLKSKKEQELPDLIERLFNQLVKRYGSKTDDDGHEIVMVEKPRVTNKDQFLESETQWTPLDTSTYNINFAEPQIKTARNFIARIFQQNVALDEKTIIHMIREIDPMLDIEFIRSALDQMIGNPPFIRPREVRDRYNRPGTIVFIGGYYLFQPLDIPSKTLPIQYRSEPLTIKRQFFNTDILVDKEAKKKEVNTYVQDTVYLDNEIARLDNALSNSIDEPYEYFLNIIDIRKQIDRMLFVDQIYIFKTVVNSFYNSSDYGDFASELISYFISQGLVLKSDDDIFYLLVDKDVLQFNPVETTKGWQRVNLRSSANADLRAKLTEGFNNLTSINLSVSDYGVSYGMLVDKKIKSRTLPVTLTGEKVKLTQGMVLKAANKINSLQKTPTDLTNLAFKIIDKTKEVKQKTKDGTTSNRTQARGLTCNSMKITQMKNMINNISNGFAENPAVFEIKTIDQEVEINQEFIDSLAANASKKTDSCYYIETFLRIMDLLKVADRRWFLSPFECELYQPEKEK